MARQHQQPPGTIDSLCTSIPLPPPWQLLNLGGNELESWDALHAVGALPRLREIRVMNNGLTRVTSAPAGTFAAVEVIDISSNNIASFDSIWYIVVSRW